MQCGITSMHHSSLLGPSFSTRELEPHSEAGQKWRVLEVIYPDGFPMHNKKQKFYFDEKFLLRMLDYDTYVTGGVVAHYCYDHKNIDGLVIPTFRRAVLREKDGTVRHELTRFMLDFVSVVINNKT
jgi:hypothetical protein